MERNVVQNKAKQGKQGKDKNGAECEQCKWSMNGTGEYRIEEQKKE
jgi:hypothetical protein